MDVQATMQWRVKSLLVSLDCVLTDAVGSRTFVSARLRRCWDDQVSIAASRDSKHGADAPVPCVNKTGCLSQLAESE